MPSQRGRHDDGCRDRAATTPVPRYGEATLADVAPSALASLGVATEPDPLGLPSARHVVVLLVDGMGWEALRSHRRHAPFLTSLLDDGTRLSVGFPTTTATSLASLGTGKPPGGHGVLGYQVAVPGQGRLINHLRWDTGIDPREWQPHRTVYERAEAAGIAARYVASSAFEHSGFTYASARGSRYRPADDPDALVAQTESALSAAERGYTVVYHPDLDTLGHTHGVDSPHWRSQLERVDRLAARLAGTLPPGTAMHVTADHGMVDVPPEGRIDVEADAELSAGVRLLGGEPRARYVYAHAGAVPDVLATWRERLAGRATVLTREEAIDEGWFGDVAPEFLARIGDVLALCHDDTALIAPTAEEVQSRLVGMHGSVTPQELYVPLLGITT